MTDAWEGLKPPYRTICADPPWPWPQTGQGRNRRGVNPGRHRDGQLDAPLTYSDMRLSDIEALPIRELVDDTQGCRLFLWVTNHHLRHGWDIIEGWGFEPQERVLVWCKPPRSTVPVTTEFILIGRRGHVPRMPWHHTTWCQWPLQARGHAVKPPAAYDLIESWCPGPYLDLFGRQGRFGWDTWGKGVE